ncbi:MULTISPECIES: hypothetical protein [Parabacteroides]|jgi:uncharacterized protein (DUF2147 family)|uniref:Lipocalin-like domain-containing protein n=1 Tax=Parabacteroides gordonii MS-1 = DSM 23371 TaxID=1203610 RepID=A0A0F5JAB7_9BACT|nr:MULTISPECIES: hypothetical protein [Parabacteroides]KKB52823.1 hypothetical protein HMPREF1212_00980 [Parabacteroides sp. HGS0025]KKB54470.1 hypothetical protein HMPREF1536_03390 [Parabacteroides gordonii MS-1 = DSM 23371]MCA5581307.1 hypothetical protein [Parabacteroides gordonii]RGP18422.1 hypothetical protein DXB27_03095 [Parabacteroides gordonii]
MKQTLIVLFLLVTFFASAQKSAFNGTWYAKEPDPSTGKTFAVSLKVKDGEIKKGQVASISMKDNKGENGKLESAVLEGNTVMITYSTKDGGIHKGSLVYNESEKTVFWKLLSSENGKTLAPDELKLDAHHY